MHLSFSAAEEQFRARARAWLSDNAPRQPRPHSGPEARTFDLAWQQQQHAGGWAGISWPSEFGGLGHSASQQLIWLEELGRAGAPVMGTLSVALGHAAPTLMALGTPEQKAFHLPKILRGEVVWCQGFSEPGAGSDLAGVAATGRIEDDVIVVNGQKIWTSHAQVADYQELLIRTEPGSSRHAGLTWIIGDMHLPGITVRPIETITGSHHYCEVFYDNVAIPIANVVGGIGGGWQAAMSTLGFERGLTTIMARTALTRDVEDLEALVHAATDRMTGQPLSSNIAVRGELAQLKAGLAGTRALTYKVVSGIAAGVAGAEAALVGLYFSELSQQVQRFAVDLVERVEEADDAMLERWHEKYLHSYCETIMGGTSEIRRNIVAQRGLGLPRS